MRNQQDTNRQHHPAVATVRGLWLWLLLSVAGITRAERFPIGDPAISKSYVEITQVFSSCLNSGCNPVRYTVRNETSDTLRFGIEVKSSVRLGSQDHVLRSSHSITAPPSQTTTGTLLLPVLAIANDTSYGRTGSADMSMTITGIANASMAIHQSLDPRQPAVGFSKALTGNDVARINRLRPDPSGSSLGFAVEFDATQVPSEWRAFAGLDYLSFTSQEWLALTPEVRAGVFQWVEGGGVLTIYTTGENESPLLNFPAHAPALGSGVLRTSVWDGKPLEVAHLATQYPEAASNKPVAPHPQLKNLRQSGVSAMSDDSYYYYNHSNEQVIPSETRWGNLSRALGERSFSLWQVAVILVIFGIIVGPVNLFVFAKPGRRHRLFWTTPLISLAASLLLILYILFSDGTGGQGVRTSIAYVNPSAATVNIRQEQICRTGLLFGGSFSLEEPAVVAPVILLDSRWTRLKANSRRAGAQQFSVLDNAWAGDWFQSRSEQAQSLQMVRSSRGRLELVNAAGAAPELRSSFAYPLEVVFYRDEKGVWKSAGSVPTGGLAKLQASSQGDFKQAMASHLFLDHPSLVELQKELPAGHFFAFTTHPTAEMIATLKAIDWNDNHTLVWGPVVTSP